MKRALVAVALFIASAMAGLFLTQTGIPAPAGISSSPSEFGAPLAVLDGETIQEIIDALGGDSMEGAMESLG